MHTPRVSILFPIYNVEPYLREAVDSMLSQTFTDFELICLDDCSPDHSSEILDSYSDPRIVRYRGEKNQGLANVLNIGMDMARGEYIARMDSDDISLPNRLQVQVDYLDSHPEIDLVSVGLIKFGKRTDKKFYPEDKNLVKYNAFFYPPVLHAPSMWRRQRFMQADLLYRQQMVPAEDYDLWTRALAKGMTLINIPVILYKYRIVGDTQATHNPMGPVKCREIRENFARLIFPKMPDDFYVDFSNLAFIANSDVEKLRQLCTIIESKNTIVHYLDNSYLHKRLKRLYQASLYNDMLKNGIIWQRVFQLRINQIIKLIFLRLTNNG